MSVASKKLEIIKWISSIEDEAVINQLDNFRKQKTFNFQKEMSNVISGEELKKKTTSFLESLEWKK